MPLDVSIPPAKSLRPVFYKDYHKEVKDLLSRHHAPPAVWKVESKFKAPKGVLSVNPSAQSDGAFDADVEYAWREVPLAVRVNIAAAHHLKGTLTFADKGHKLEGKWDTKGAYELGHEWALHDRLRAHAKWTSTLLEVGVGVPLHPLMQIGAGVCYPLKGKPSLTWTLAGRFVYAGCVGDVRIQNGKGFTIGVLAPLRVHSHRATLAAELVWEREKVLGTVGAEWRCPLFKGNTLKGRVNKERNWAVTYLAKLADNWTASITLDKNRKAGVIFSHS